MELNVNNNIILIDEDDYNLLGKKHIHIVKSRKNIYAIYKSDFLHRVIMNAPKGMEVDHKNGNTLDNRKCNLRICTSSQNSMNKHTQKNNTTGYKGVSYIKRRRVFETRIKAGKQKIWLGYYKTAQEAYAVYCEAVKKYHGEFGSFK